jgi:hypothetical protein
MLGAIAEVVEISVSAISGEVHGSAPRGEHSHVPQEINRTRTICIPKLVIVVPGKPNRPRRTQPSHHHRDHTLPQRWWSCAFPLLRGLRSSANETMLVYAAPGSPFGSAAPYLAFWQDHGRRYKRPSYPGITNRNLVADCSLTDGEDAAGVPCPPHYRRDRQTILENCLLFDRIAFAVPRMNGHVPQRNFGWQLLRPVSEPAYASGRKRTSVPI